MIQLKNIRLRRGARILLEDVSLTLNPGEKVGLVGRNGAGKSTVFALIAGRLHEDGGDFSMPADWRMAEVEQHMPETSDTATDFVLAGDSRLAALRAALAEADARHEADPDDIDAGMAVGDAHAALADAGEHDAVPRAQSLILGLGFKVEELDSPVDSFSGGWRMRLQLARALMSPSDLLLLDEPTNHLDIDALVWLEAWLKRYAGTMIVISHDREFLDAVTAVTVHVDQQRLVRYGGNYSAFETLRSQQLALQSAAFSKQQDKIAHLQKFIDRFKAKASKAKQAQSRVKALERMEQIAPVLADADFDFEFKEPPHLPNPMLSISSGVFGYRAGEDDTSTAKPILRGINRSVLAGQRIGILGANGQGKSTFVKTVARDVPLISGQITEGKGLTIGYFAQQELDVLHASDNPLEHMTRIARDVGPAGREQELRNFLGTFNFSGEMVKQSIGTMSGGEKARLVLATIVWQRPNLLLLDEPTNHLDLATREALAVALNEFEGTVLLVSHDRALLRAVCDEFWLVAAGGIAPFDGDMDEYQQYLLDESRRVRERAAADRRQVAAAASADSTVAIKNIASETRSTWALSGFDLKSARKELAAVDLRLAELHVAVERDEATLAAAGPRDGVAEAGRRLKAARAELATLEERWLSLSDSIERAGSPVAG